MSNEKIRESLDQNLNLLKSLETLDLSDSIDNSGKTKFKLNIETVKQPNFDPEFKNQKNNFIPRIRKQMKNGSKQPL